MPRIKRYREKASGQFVSKEVAEKYPQDVKVETVKPKKKNK